MTFQSTSDRYLAISGGGYQTISLSAGWLAGGMDGTAISGRDDDIDQLLGNIKGLSSSSGGSLFSSMLAYSSTFRGQFESKAGRDSWNSSGYNWQVGQMLGSLFDEDGTPKLSPIAKSYVEYIKAALNKTKSLLWAYGIKFDTECLMDSVQQAAMAYTLLDGNSGFGWRDFVDAYIYTPMGIDAELKNINLTSQRNSWAQDVDLIFGAAMQTSPVVLGKIGSRLTKGYTRVSALPRQSTVPSEQQFTPLSVISEAPNQISNTPRAAALFTAGPLKATYSSLGLQRGHAITKIIPSRLSNTLSLIDASTISGAFGAIGAGIGATASVLTKSHSLQSKINKILSPISHLLRNMAPAAGTAHGVLGPLEKSPDTVGFAAQVGALRLADSAYADNTAIGHLLRQIQDTKGLEQPFSIVLLMNSNEAPDPITGMRKRVRVGPDASNLSLFGLPSEVTNLFGQSAGDGSIDGDSITMVRFPFVKVPSAHLFNESAWYGRSAPDWSFKKGSISISYNKLDVTTVENKSFGVKPGQRGQLHVFSAINTESQPLPFKLNVLGEYEKNYDVIREAIAGGGGFPYLQDALGLKPAII